MSGGVWDEAIERCIKAGIARRVTIDDPGIREAVNKAAENTAKAIDAKILADYLRVLRVAE